MLLYSLVDNPLTAGHSGDIAGELLKVHDPESAEQGVFLVNTQKKEEIKVLYLHRNTAKTLQVEWPDGLRSGQEYRLEVRSAVNGGKEVRTGSSAKPLKVK